MLASRTEKTKKGGEMEARGIRTRSIEGAARLFDRASMGGKPDAIADATASIVSTTIFLEEAVGPERTIAILYATIEAVRNGRHKKN